MVPGGGALAAPGSVRASDAPASTGFVDVPPGHLFEEDIGWLVGQGFAQGFGDGRFGPALPVTRQALAVMLFRLANPGEEPPSCTAAPFDDVPTDHLFCGAIKWLADEGIALGAGGGRFLPAEHVSRGAFAAFLFRLDRPGESPARCERDLADDVSSNNLFCGVILWLAGEGVTSGFGDGTFGTARPVTRQELAAFLRRFVERPALHQPEPAAVTEVVGDPEGPVTVRLSPVPDPVPAVGDRLVVGVGAATPEGLLVEVTSVAVDGGAAVLGAVPASYFDVVPVGSLDTVIELGAEDLAEGVDGLAGSHGPAAVDAVAARSPLLQSISESVDCGAEAGFEVGGSVETTVAFPIELAWDPFHGLEGSVATTVAETAELTAAITGEASCELGPVPLGPPIRFAPQIIPVAPPPVPPLIFTPVLSFSLSARAQAEAAVSTSVTQQLTVTAGVERVAGQFRPVSDVTNGFSFQEPTAEGSASIEGQVDAHLDYLLYQLVGPQATVGASIRAAVSYDEEPCWELAGGLHAGAALVIPAAGLSWGDPEIVSAEVPIFRNESTDGPVCPPFVPADVVDLAEEGVDTQLAWTPDAAEDLAGFRILRDGVEIADVGPEIGTEADPFVDPDLEPGRPYVYEVSAYDSHDLESEPSEPLTVVPSPTGLSVEENDEATVLTVTWDPHLVRIEHDGIEIERDGEIVATLPSNARTFDDVGISAGEEHRYRVRISLADGTASRWSAPVDLLSLRDVDGTLVWSAAHDPSATTYQLHRDGALVTEVAAVPGRTSYEHDGDEVDPGDVATYVVTAHLDDGTEVARSPALVVAGAPTGLDGGNFECQPLVWWDAITDPEAFQAIEVELDGTVVGSLGPYDTIWCDYIIVPGPVTYRVRLVAADGTPGRWSEPLTIDVEVWQV